MADGTPAFAGIRLGGAGTACDNDRCSVLVYNADGPRFPGSITHDCPGCGHEGFAVRFGIGVDEITSEAAS